MSPLKFNFRYNQPVKLPNGRVTRINLINHPGAVIIAPFLNKKTVVMMRQFRPVLKKYIYELPAGTIDPGERPVRCARRELLEETGLKAGLLAKLGAIYPVPGYSTEVIHIFKAEQLTMTQAQPEDYEVIDIMPMSRSEVRALLKKGKLMDAKSICALVLCGWL
ncbi:MAG: NUDIX hydrolase [Candidatus Omnitrophica bacterium]|nr:NUDIX hydrolase [Candidatus Omnitrophota bacterium]